MKKSVFVFCVLSIFFAGLLAAQSDAGQDSAQESVPQESADPSEKKRNSIKEKVKEITEGVQEYNDKNRWKKKTAL